MNFKIRGGGKYFNQEMLRSYNKIQKTDEATTYVSKKPHIYIYIANKQHKQHNETERERKQLKERQKKTFMQKTFIITFQLNFTYTHFSFDFKYIVLYFMNV